MKRTNRIRIPGGVWSAAPTPFTADMRLDKVAVRRMVEHHVRLGVCGLFLAGTNGEGPWLTDRQRRELFSTVVRCVRGRLPVAAQVTDNSAARIVDNMRLAADFGVDIAVIAPPFFLANVTPRTIARLYVQAIEACPLPVGIYDRGNAGAVVVDEKSLGTIYGHPKVAMIKDSSTLPAHMQLALEARRKRPSLKLLTGWEFHCVEYLEAGYDGLLLGGGVFNGYLANRIVQAVASGEGAKAWRLQARMNRIMYAVYGGRKIACWLSGEKYLLMRLGMFRSWKNYPDYPLTPATRRAIREVLRRDRDALMPWEANR